MSIFRAMRTTMLGTSVLATLLVLDAWRTQPALLTAWWLAGASMVAFRLRQARRFQALPQSEREASARAWEWRLVGSAALSAGFWVAGTLLLTRTGDEHALAFMGFVLTGVVGASLAALAGSSRAFAMVVGPLVVTYEVLLVREAATGHDWSMVVAVPIYGVTLIAAAERLARRVRSAIRLRLQQATLVAQVGAARDAAEASASARAQFLAVMSHEIRTPLAGVVGMSGLLRGTPLTGEQREYALAMEQSAQALMVLLDDVLDLSKIDAGRIELEARDFSLREELETLTRLMAFRAREKGLTLALALAPEVPARARGDWPRLRQVLVNLLGNALKFTSEGTVRLAVTASTPEEGALALQAEVTDPGIGLSPHEVSRLFQPFTQADASTSRRFGGTGLGLYISQQLAQRMGGAITVDSVPGRGSTFRVSVRLQPAQAANGLEGSSSPAPGKPAGVAEVLVVEDDAVNLLVARRLLERAGHTVTAARTGLEALRSLSEAHFDLVLMDLQLPELDGLAATRRLRTDATGRNQGVPVIALTADASADHRQTCLAAGFSDFLTKPVAPEALAAAIRRWTAPAPEP